MSALLSRALACARLAESADARGAAATEKVGSLASTNWRAPSLAGTKEGAKSAPYHRSYCRILLLCTSYQVGIPTSIKRVPIFPCGRAMP